MHPTHIRLRHLCFQQIYLAILTLKLLEQNRAVLNEEVAHGISPSIQADIPEFLDTKRRPIVSPTVFSPQTVGYFKEKTKYFRPSVGLPHRMKLYCTYKFDI